MKNLTSNEVIYLFYIWDPEYWRLGNRQIHLFAVYKNREDKKKIPSNSCTKLPKLTN